MSVYLRRLCVAVLLLSLAQASIAQTGAFEFSDHSQRLGPLKTELNLDQAMLGIVALAAGAKDPELTEVIRKIEKVSVRVYSAGDEYAYASSLLDTYSARLKKAHWFNVFNKNDDGELTRVFTQSKNSLISGVVVLRTQATEKELTLVNIVGEIDPVQVQRVAKTLSLDLGLN